MGGVPPHTHAPRATRIWLSGSTPSWTKKRPSGDCTRGFGVSGLTAGASCIWWHARQPPTESPYRSQTAPLGAKPSCAPQRRWLGWPPAPSVIAGVGFEPGTARSRATRARRSANSCRWLSSCPAAPAPAAGVAAGSGVRLRPSVPAALPAPPCLNHGCQLRPAPHIARQSRHQPCRLRGAALRVATPLPQWPPVAPPGPAVPAPPGHAAPCGRCSSFADCCPSSVRCCSVF